MTTANGRVAATVGDVLANRDGARWACACSDAVAFLEALPANSVHCCVTSPPYYCLRDYGTASWEGGDSACEHTVGNQVQDAKAPGAITTGVRPGVDASHCRRCGAVRVDQQIGLENTPDDYVAKLVSVFREVRRVLHPSGVLWLNLGDSFNAYNGNRGASKSLSANIEESVPTLAGGHGLTVKSLKPKDMIGIPWLVAFALRADGWYLRQECPWVKRNPMPESVDDRPGTATEKVFLFSKTPDYFFDMNAVKRKGSVNTRDQYQRAVQLANAAGLTPEHLDAIRSAGITDTGKATVTQSGTGKNCERVTELAHEAKRALGGYYREFLMSEDRNFRSSDLWFDSVGLLFGDDGEMLGFDVPVNGYKGAHFATFPRKLVEPAVAAIKEGRKCILIEKDPRYMAMARKRVAHAIGDGPGSLFAVGKPA